MKGLLYLVVSLFLVLGVVTGSTAHAAEIGIGRSAIASVDGCPGLSKQSDDASKQGKGFPSDDSKSLVKFHGCHGHHVGMPVDPTPGKTVLVKVEVLPAGPTTGVAPPAFFGTFRPPIA